MQRRGRFHPGIIVVLAVLGLSMSRASAQVDWGDVFSEEKAPPPKKAAPAVPAAAPEVRQAPVAAPAAPKVKAERPRPAAERKAPVAAAPESAPESQPVAAPKAVKREAPAAPVAVAPEPAEEAPPAPVAPKAAKREAPAAPAAAAPEPVEEAPPAPAPVKQAAPKAAASASVTLAEFGLKEGDVVNVTNLAQYNKLVPPGLEWAVRYGLRMKVVEAKRVDFPARYREATEKNSGQVRLGPGGLTIENYTAGLPFPRIDPNEPAVAQKIMWNYYHNITQIDDVMQRGVDTYTGPVTVGKPIEVERHILLDSYRKLLYTGRLYIEPKPTMPNPEGTRFKESLHPLLEPFDLKGVGFTSYRYIDPAKQDDSWLYLPQLRRVRRMSTGQRSDALFGQDTDADAFAGYNGHIAWMDFKLLGEQTVLASMHATHSPVKWQQPEDWLWDDTWEPRRVYVVEARSKIPQYAYSKRILFIDREAWIVTVADSYDRAEQLWKSHYIKWNIRTDSKSKMPDAFPCQEADIISDVQLQHVTSTGIPRRSDVVDGGFHSNVGEAGGVTEEYFTVADLIKGGH